MPPPDSRRICGPDTSKDYRLFVTNKHPERSAKGRPDGRIKDDEHRPICKWKTKKPIINVTSKLIYSKFTRNLTQINYNISVMKTSVISQAKGSAYLEQGQTKVVCGVYGPREIPRRYVWKSPGLANALPCFSF